MFKDVNPKAWFANAVDRLVKRRVMQGYEDGTFRPDNFVSRKELAAALDQDYRHRYDILQEIAPAVIQLRGPNGSGSGYVIDKNTIVTNVHVVLTGADRYGNINQLEVVLDDGTVIPSHNVRVPYGDGARDCAVVKVPDLDIKPVTLGSETWTAEDCFVIGFPLGFANSISKGIVSHDRRMVESPYGGAIRWIQTDAAINPGNSGGALINRYGELIGMPTWRLFESGDGRNVDNMAFALHLEEIKYVIGQVNSTSVNLGIEHKELALKPFRVAHSGEVYL